jgi:hypothetical protein
LGSFGLWTKVNGKQTKVNCGFQCFSFTVNRKEMLHQKKNDIINQGDMKKNGVHEAHQSFFNLADFPN